MTGKSHYLQLMCVLTLDVLAIAPISQPCFKTEVAKKRSDHEEGHMLDLLQEGRL